MIMFQMHTLESNLGVTRSKGELGQHLNNQNPLTDTLSYSKQARSQPQLFNSQVMQNPPINRYNGPFENNRRHEQPLGIDKSEEMRRMAQEKNYNSNLRNEAVNGYGESPVGYERTNLTLEDKKRRNQIRNSYAGNNSPIEARKGTIRQRNIRARPAGASAYDQPLQSTILNNQLRNSQLGFENLEESLRNTASQLVTPNTRDPVGTRGYNPSVRDRIGLLKNSIVENSGIRANLNINQPLSTQQYHPENHQLRNPARVRILNQPPTNDPYLRDSYNKGRVEDFRESIGATNPSNNLKDPYIGVSIGNSGLNRPSTIVEDYNQPRASQVDNPLGLKHSTQSRRTHDINRVGGNFETNPLGAREQANQLNSNLRNSGIRETNNRPDPYLVESQVINPVVTADPNIK